MDTTNVDRRSALRLSAAAGLSAVLAACAGNPRDTPGAPAPRRLMFIRHAEEPSSKNGFSGVTQEGSADPRSLTVRGWTRAGALVSLFDPRDATGKPVPTRTDLDRPTMIVAPDPGRTESRRSLETVIPLAAALDLRVDARFTTAQTTPVADAIRAASGPVLIAWKHDQIDDIISHLAGVTPAPPPWPGSRFDLIYVLTRNGGGWRFVQVPQMLLAGDREV